jgi:hypothetical protein
MTSTLIISRKGAKKKELKGVSRRGAEHAEDI